MTKVENGAKRNYSPLHRCRRRTLLRCASSTLLIFGSTECCCSCCGCGCGTAAAAATCFVVLLLLLLSLLRVEGTLGEAGTGGAVVACCVVVRRRLRRRGCLCCCCCVVWFVLWLAGCVGGVVVSCVVDVAFVVVSVVRLLRLRLKRRLSDDSSIRAAPPASRVLRFVTPRRPKASL